MKLKVYFYLREFIFFFRADSLDPALRRAGRFDREIGLGIPDTGARQKILEVICRNLRLEAGTDMARLALLTPGMFVRITFSKTRFYPSQ